ncbi:MAG TPA: ATPase, T2SS/T4P/T4SS family [Planctomycetaceae bacterium]|jgi:general secretion pathway protein E|nr:ATPase, T2SS/T4P/T4SS family [Planctomycetaceae bacterium]
MTTANAPESNDRLLQARLVESLGPIGAPFIPVTQNPLRHPGDSLVARARGDDIQDADSRQASTGLSEVPVVADLRLLRPYPLFVKRFPIGFARQHGVVALVGEVAEPVVVISGPDDWPALDTVNRVLGIHAPPLFAPREEILGAINSVYEQGRLQPDVMLDSIGSDDAASKLKQLEARDDLLATDGQAPVVELVNLILLDAVKGAASDIHFQPYRENLVVRYRIDGVLFDAHTVPKTLQDEVLSRIKVLGKMDIAEKRLPQDGRATVTVGDRVIDLRIASLPGNYGERIVLRLLDKSTRVYSLSEVGMDEETQARVRELIALEHGLILLTGPTGSGKTTTLYAALQEINTRDRNVLTLEDPIEYDIEGISQTQINVKKGLTFASGLRNVLRQDPDIIMVGEIRDHETAVMAIQSALTGHLVFSTLHTNDAASAVTRLLDLGIEPYLVSSSLLAVLAQRLVRKVCAKCSIEKKLTGEERVQLDLVAEGEPNVHYRSGHGCPACRNTGYRGRVAICELLRVDEAIRRQIQIRASATDIRDTAVRAGMRLLRGNGIDKIFAGITTPAEVARVTVRTRA